MEIDYDTMLGLHNYEVFTLDYKKTIEHQFIFDDALKEMLETQWTYIDVESGIGHKKAVTLHVGKKCPTKEIED